KDGKEVYLMVSPELLPLQPASIATHDAIPDSPNIVFVQKSNVVTAQSKDKKREKVRLPAKTIRELEKHNRKGIGIYAGPALDISQGVYPVGEGAADLGGGLLAEFVLSPSLSLESGVKYMFRNYHIDN